MATIRAMKIQTMFPIATVALLLLGGMAPHVSVAQTGGPGSPTWYAVEQGMTSGGGYRLSSLGVRLSAHDEAWHVSGTAGGGVYRLTDAGQAEPWGNCCCTFLPVVLRNF